MEIRSSAAPGQSRGQGLRAAVLYGGLSLSMVFLNKVLLSRFVFDYTIALMFLQFLSTLIVMEALRMAKMLDIARYTLERGKNVLIISLCYAMHSTLALNALAGMNIPMYGTIKRCTPLASLFLLCALGKKGRPSRGTIIAVSTLTLGALIASYHDLSFDAAAYRDGALSVACQAIYFILVENLASECSLLDLTYLNAFNGVVIMLVFDFFNEELRDVAMFFLTTATWHFYVVFLTTIATSVALNMAAFHCLMTTSAVTTSVVGNAKAILQTILGFIFGHFWLSGVAKPPQYSGMNIFGIIVNIIGCMLYTYVKYREAPTSAKALVVRSLDAGVGTKEPV